MTIKTTITCDLKGTQCLGEVDKHRGSPPQKRVLLQGAGRIDLCPPCVKHAKQQLRDQTGRSS